MASSVPSLRSVAKFVLGSLQFGLGPGYRGVDAGTPLSCSSPQLSCHNTTAVADTCCFNAPGGQLLLTQFWDANPATGPSDSWTLHGLWPDHCDGTYDANCDSTRFHSNIRDILLQAGKQDLVSFMDIYWKDYKGCDDSFWEHEWDKHGTCISTLSPSCYSGYTQNQEVVDFFQKAVDLFKGLDTYKSLAATGIVPSDSATYTSQQIVDALSAATGHTPTIGCKSGQFNEVWYHFNVRGSAQNGQYIATEPDGTKSTCPSSGIKYLPKSSSPPTCSTGSPPPPPPPTSIPGGPTNTATYPLPSPTGTPFSGKGYLNVLVAGSANGCIISSGKWYTSGTCATFTASPSGSGFTLTSSKGPCALSSSNGALTCASSVTAATEFSASNALLSTTDGSTDFYADAVAKGFTQQTVYGTARSVGIQVSWQQV